MHKVDINIDIMKLREKLCKNSCSAFNWAPSRELDSR